MKTSQFLKHHGILANPFSEEDAQTDALFKRVCLTQIHHPAWSKFYGDPSEPSTALIFGEKGSGKTALRLQATAEIERHNASSADARAFLISYDDFNPFLDHFVRSLRAQDVPKALARFRLADHMDAILALAVTKLVDELNASKLGFAQLTLDQRRDLLLLAALYDHSTGEPVARRWSKLRRRSRFRPLWGRLDLQIGVGAAALAILLIWLLPSLRSSGTWIWLVSAAALSWSYWGWRLFRAEVSAREVRKGIRVLGRDQNELRRQWLWFKPADLSGQPLPDASDLSGETRYELLRKLQALLKPLGYAGIIVIVDRVDEPQLIEGDPRRMRTLIWPIMDNKFLRHPGIGLKMLLPIELAYYLEKEDREFYERARPDKLNMVKPLRWTGPSLYDLATDRLRACADPKSETSSSVRLRDLIDETISDDSLKDALEYLRTPRQLFKFMHRLIEEHCHRHTEDNPRWTIEADTFRTVYSAHRRDLDAFDRGYGHG